jgi:hypothetical protein
MFRKPIVALALTLAVSVALVGVSRAAPAAQKQRVAIDSKLIPPGDTGTFKLTPFGKGPPASDSGTWTYADAGSTKGVRYGQAYERNRGTITFTGKHGTLVIREDETTLHITPGLRDIGTGTWVVVRGAGAYAYVKGSGRMAGWYIRTGQSLERYEGFLTSG